MRYGERLNLARGDRTQEWLASEAKVSQSLIWQLENSKTAKGSQYTVRFARALGVSADWLADEIGEMIVGEAPPRDLRIAYVIKVMESLPDYAIDKVKAEADSTAALVAAIRNDTTAAGRATKPEIKIPDNPKRPATAVIGGPPGSAKKTRASRLKDAS